MSNRDGNEVVGAAAVGRKNNVPVCSIVGTGVTVTTAIVDTGNAVSLYGWMAINVTNVAQANAAEFDFTYPLALAVNSVMEVIASNAAGSQIGWGAANVDTPTRKVFGITPGNFTFPALGTYYITYHTYPSI
jgi:hypothetical protein